MVKNIDIIVFFQTKKNSEQGGLAGWGGDVNKCGHIWWRGSCHATHCLPYIIVMMPGSTILRFFSRFLWLSPQTPKLTESLLYDDPYPHTLYTINHTLLSNPTSTTANTQLVTSLHLPPYAFSPPFEFPFGTAMSKKPQQPDHEETTKRKRIFPSFSRQFHSLFRPFTLYRSLPPSDI